MFEGLKNGWRLAKTVRKSVSREKSLYIYPVVIGIISALVFILTFIGIFISIPLSNSYIDYYYIAGLFFSYIVIYFIATLLILTMMISYRSFNSGNKISFGDAFSQSRKFAVKALEWAVLYSILLMILRAIESRFRGIGGILIGAIGSFAITVATFFAVPAILDYNTGPINAIKKSVETIRQNFGNTFGGIIYIDLYTLIFEGSGIILLIASAFTLGITAYLTVALISAGLILLILGLILNFTYTNIFKLILFDFVNGKGLPEGFDKNLIMSAIKFKGNNSSGFNNMLLNQ